MNEELRQMLSSLVDGLESLWLENLAMRHLLDQCEAPNWYGLMHEFCQRASSKARAHEKFAPYRALIQAAQMDSKALESLLDTLSTKGKPN
jgi:hypothetical protein